LYKPKQKINIMPVCYITLSESVRIPSIDEVDIIRDIVAEGLNSKSRFLDRTHIVIRIQQSQRQFMLGEVEIEIFAQLYLRRFFSRDKRAKLISQKISELLEKDCATWINMGMVGYSRVTTEGQTYFSD
jgi:hypothetical protein